VTVAASSVRALPDAEICGTAAVEGNMFTHVGQPPLDADGCMAWLAPHGVQEETQLSGCVDPDATVMPPHTTLLAHTASVVGVAAVTWYCPDVHCVDAAHTVFSSPNDGEMRNCEGAGHDADVLQLLPLMYCPAGHAPQTRSVVAVGAVVSRWPPDAEQVVVGKHMRAVVAVGATA
jgi:hypothetical protein